MFYEETLISPFNQDVDVPEEEPTPEETEGGDKGVGEEKGDVDEGDDAGGEEF